MPNARPNVAPLRLDDLREGESRRITYALSHYVQGAGPHVAAYAGAVLTKINGAALICLTSAQVVGLHALSRFEQPPTTAEEYRQLLVALARHYSTKKYPSFEA